MSPSFQSQRELPAEASSVIQRPIVCSPRPNGAARHAKRLTLNFPINVVPGLESDPSVTSPESMTPATFSAARPSPLPAAGTPVVFDDQDDGSSLLTAIASQERKVLELREELQRAEAELDTLKKQWASSEKTKKRTEINHRAEPLLPLRSPDRATHDESSQHRTERSAGTADGSSAVQTRRSRDLERRQSLRASVNGGTAISANGRRVFQGSHTRALSLLSPVNGPGVNQQFGADVDGNRATRTPRSATLPSVERAATTEMNERPTEDMISQWRRTMPPPSREALVRTGKQMASDLREGLWTFLEDIRQATVGEEGINATQSRGVPPARKRDFSSASRSRDRLSVHGGKSSRSPSSSRGKAAGTQLSGKDTKSADIDVSFWSEFGIDTAGQKSTKARGASNTPRGATEQETSNNLDVEENWDDWDTPQPKKTHTPSSSRSTLESKHDQSPVTQNSSPRTSGSFGDWRATQDDFVPDPSVSDGIPWPAITKFAPSKLTRTASNLMAEWERSLSPSPERKNQTSSPPLNKDDKKD
ncbi:DUF4048 domain-containing protein [Aspergillus novofumigatus IBT 16806]|uniref:DUF4048 domain-containing protein n=1 Tax=Aspergillus novofumigatus (strain IBT 16806) TaxID=1392255 RepID=A0A2I1CFV3_ASPN1|nr:uncharacterized protein P174DRAFT_438281 [Aspergillus novofumigatus IBT 16806]PKX96509.1 hypothetical protein P174DRAFT_438281 [Aspergillus novofumigatus IBT 16806]